MDSVTKDVEVLLGDPKKALISMTIPIAIANIILTLNNIVDGIWVAGVGTSALAAVGVVFPIFFIILGIGNGIGIGASQAIANRIGANNFEGANKAASQAIVLTCIAGVACTAIFLLFSKPILTVCGAGDYMDDCYAYALPIAIGAVAIMLSSLFCGLLRSEGAAKRSMIIQIAGVVLNMIIDPIFIYTFNFGIMGASVATIISMMLSIGIGVYWYCIKRDTQIKISLRNFRFDRKLDTDILKVGLPASIEMAMIAISAMLMNLILLKVDPTNGVAIYSAGWRVIDMVMIPVMAFGNAIVPICAAALGANQREKIRDAYFLATKYGVIIMLILASITALAAPIIVVAFTYSESTSALAPDMITFIRICCIFLPIIPWGFVSGGFFQAMGMGGKALISTIIRNCISLPICYTLSFGGDLSSIWYGLDIGEIVGTILMGVWAVIILKRIVREGLPNSMSD